MLIYYAFSMQGMKAVRERGSAPIPLPPLPSLHSQQDAGQAHSLRVSGGAALQSMYLHRTLAAAQVEPF